MLRISVVIRFKMLGLVFWFELMFIDDLSYS